MTQLDLFPPAYVVVWKRGDILEDQRTFHSESRARRFLAGLEHACSLAHKGSTLLIDTRTPMLPPSPSPAITPAGQQSAGDDDDRIRRHVR